MTDTVIQASSRSVDTIEGGFLPSMAGLKAGLLAPMGDRMCAHDYLNGDGPFRHAACHDPRRFMIVAAPATVLGGRMIIAANAATGPIVAFQYGVSEVDPQFAGFGPRTYADTNVEKGGYLVPAGTEGLVCAFGASPVGITPAPANNAVANWADATVNGIDYEAGWRRIFSGIYASLEYWETTTKAERVLGNIERWPVGDAMDHPQLAANGGRGAFSRLNPLQYHVPTLGPAERRGDDRADRLVVNLNIPRQIEVALDAGGTALPDAPYLVLIRIELAVGLMVDKAKQPDVRQDRMLGEQERRMAALEKQLADLAALIRAGQQR